jgi:predicted DNA-binding protein (MmcQ/YjbR family)
MNAASIRKFCLSLPGATHDIKWGVDQVYSVGGKMFAVIDPTKAGSGAVAFKVDDTRFLELTDREGIIPAPYLARAKWVKLTDLRKLGDTELKELLARSHALVAAKLTKKVRESLQ